ncbi:MAG: DUF5317 family protein [Actinomycetota bacterium]
MISLSVILVALGLLAGLARGGKIGNITVTRFRLAFLVFAGLGIQTAAELYAAFGDRAFRDDGRGLAILGISYALLIIFVAANIRLPGALLIGLGLALNLAVIIPNGGMPVSLRAAAAAGFNPSGYLESAVKHRELGPATRFPFLADIIPLPVLRKVISPGDIVQGLGIFFLVEGLVRYNPKRNQPGQALIADTETG